MDCVTRRKENTIDAGRKSELYLLCQQLRKCCKGEFPCSIWCDFSTPSNIAASMGISMKQSENDEHTMIGRQKIGDKILRVTPVQSESSLRSSLAVSIVVLIHLISFCVCSSSSDFFKEKPITNIPLCVIRCIRVNASYIAYKWCFYTLGTSKVS